MKQVTAASAPLAPTRQDPPMATFTRERVLAAEVAQPHAGQVLVGIRVRRPYQSAVSLIFCDASLLPQGMSTLAVDKLAKIASTSELLGATNKLRAMARAVRRRSYAAIAASCSLFGALWACIAIRRVSNSSVMSKGAPSVVGKGHRSNAPSTQPGGGA